MTKYNSPVEMAACPECGLVLLSDDSPHLTRCIGCELDVDVRLDDDIDSIPLDHEEFRSRLEWETVVELIPAMKAYLSDKQDDPDVWVTHVPWRQETLPAGYTEQERFVPIIRFSSGAMAQGISTESTASETLNNLRDAGYVNES